MIGGLLRFPRRAHPDEAGIRDSLERGIESLAGMQRPDGAFAMEQRRKGGGPWRPSHPLFATLTVLLAADRLLPEDAVTRALAFVRECRRSDGTWEYDPTLGIPPDADCVACATIVLARHGQIGDGARERDILLSCWRPGGPFRTWLTDDIAWNDPERDDPVVNCNILAALRALGAPPSPEDAAAVRRFVGRFRSGSRYYRSPTTIAYAARRAGMPLYALHARVRARPRCRTGILPLAEWLSATGAPHGGMLTRLLETQSGAGSWPAEPWCRGWTDSEWGGSAITTAFCVKALAGALAALPEQEGA